MTSRVNIAVYNAILERSKAKGAALAFLLVLAKWADDQGVCWPSVGTIAKTMQITTRQVQRIQAALAIAGQLDIEVNAGPGRVNRYHIRCVPPQPVRETTTVKSAPTTSAPGTTKATWGHDIFDGAPTTKPEISPSYYMNNQREEGATTTVELVKGDGEPACRDAVPTEDSAIPAAEIRTEIEKRVDAHLFKTFFRHTRFVGIDSGVLAVDVPNEFFADVVSKKEDVIMYAARTVGLEICGVRVAVPA